MALTLVNVTPKDTALFPLVKRAYDSVFVKEFPNTDMEDDYDKIIEMLQGGMDNVSAVVNVFVDDTGGDQRPVGIAIGYYYHDSATGLLIYNAVDPAYRGHGIGKAFVQSRIDSMKAFAKEDGKTLRGAFIDVKNPAKYDAFEQKMDPQLRISIFKKWGANIIPINYVLPPNTPNGLYDDKVLLMSYNIDGMKGGPSETRDFIKSFYGSELKAQGADPKKDTELKRMIREIAEREKELAITVPYRGNAGRTPAP